MNPKAKPLCVARLDRLRVCSWAKNRRKLPRITEFKIISDQMVKTGAYQRVRVLQSLSSHTRVFWQYRRRHGWLAAWRITWVGDDSQGVAPMEVLRILKRCRYFRFLLVELALDFDSTAGVDRKFVKRHGLFGKSRTREDRGGPGQLRYGSRRSGKLVRCYWKPAVNAYRVELEFHSRILAKGKHPKEDRNYNLLEIPDNIFPFHCREHFRFVYMRWRGLERYLIRRFGAEKAVVILRNARTEAGVSLQRLTAFLRRCNRVNNVHRFFRPMRINREINDAIIEWLVNFHEEWNKRL